MGNVNCELAGLFQGCCDKSNAEELENAQENETYHLKNGGAAATATAGGDVVCGGNVGSTVITNQNNTGISAGVMNVKGNIFHGAASAPVQQNYCAPAAAPVSAQGPPSNRPAIA